MTIFIEREKEREYEQEPDSYKERFMRLTADFENYKRRTEKDRLQWARMAQATVLKALLCIVDDLDRAVGSEQGEAAKQENQKGLFLIQKNMHKILGQLGVSVIDLVIVGD